MPWGKERRYCALSSFKVAQCVDFVEHILQAETLSTNLHEYLATFQDAGVPQWHCANNTRFRNVDDLSEVAPLDNITFAILIRDGSSRQDLFCNLIRQYFSLAVHLRCCCCMCCHNLDMNWNFSQNPFQFLRLKLLVSFSIIIDGIIYGGILFFHLFSSSFEAKFDRHI